MSARKQKFGSTLSAHERALEAATQEPREHAINEFRTLISGRRISNKDGFKGHHGTQK